MSIFLYQKQNCKDYSTGDYNSGQGSSRPIERYNTQSNQYKTNTQRSRSKDIKNSRFNFQTMDRERKVYNMTDSGDKRIKREHTYLHQKSQKENALFEKGIKKIDLRNLTTEKKVTQQPIKKYHNTTSYNILIPEGNVPLKFTKKQVNLKEKEIIDNAAGCLIAKETTSKIKNIPNQRINKESSQQSSEQFLVPVLSGHKNTTPVWLNKCIHLKFNKKTNLNSKESEINHNENNKSLNVEKKHFANKSNIELTEKGIVKKVENDQEKKKQIDFTQNYYQILKRDPTVKTNYFSNCMSSRRF